MPNHDFQGMVAGRVGNEVVDALMIANELIWEAANRPLYTVFEEAAVSGTTSHNDTPTNSWIAQYFAKYPGPALEIVDLGIYIPVGGNMIGQSSGKIGIQYNATFFNGAGSYANAIPGATDTVFSQTLVAGWNWIPFNSPLAWTDSFPHILAAYSINTHYLFNSTLTSAAIASPSAKFELDASQSAGGNRSWYAPGTAGNLFSETASRFYGIDVRVREA